MQEKFNKDLEEIKNSQSIMNNAITEIKSTLEGTNSRITEAEDSGGIRQGDHFLPNKFIERTFKS